MNKILLLILTIWAIQLATLTRSYAQTTRDIENKEQSRRVNNRASKGKLKISSYVESQKEFQNRMEKVAKEHKKRDRMMKKPQYSDPTYFGHRRPPKKRPVGKRKMCKECGIVH